MTNVTYGENRFFGVDAYNDPAQVPPGFLVACDNFVTESGADGDGGLLVLRGGKRGHFTTTLAGGPLYGLTSVQQSDGTPLLLFVSGAGKLFKASGAATVPTEIRDASNVSLSLDGQNVWFAQAGGRVYFCDAGANTPLRYTDLSTSFAVASLVKPSAPPVASLISLPLLAGAGTLSWGQDYAKFINGGTTGFGVTLFDGAGGRADNNFQTAWNLQNGANNVNILDANHDACCEFDNINESAESPALVFPNTGEVDLTVRKYARVGLLSFEYAAEDTGSDNPSEVIEVSVSAYPRESATLTGLETASVVVSAITPQAGQNPARKGSYLVDMRNLISEPAGLRVKFRQPFDRPGIIGTDVNHVTFVPAYQAFTLEPQGGSGDLVVKQGGYQVFEGRLLCGGGGMETDRGAGQNWSRAQKLLLGLRLGTGLTLDTLRLRLYFRKNADLTRYYTNDLILLDSGTEAIVDISTVDSAVLSDFRYLGIEVRDDVSVPGLSQTGSFTLFTLGTIREAGNLPVGFADISYRLVEIDATADAANLFNVVQSDGSAASVALTPDVRRAVADLILPTWTNTGVSAVPTNYRYFKVFRFGGTPQDNFGYLVGIVSDAASFALGAAPALAGLPGNPYLTWDKDTRHLLDNTPDSYLLGAEVYETGRQAPPKGAKDGVEHANRLWLAVGSTLYGSWLLTDDRNAGLYYTTDILDAQGDPSAAIKGFTSPVGGDIRDPIARLIPFQDRLIATKTVSRPWVLQGTDPASGFDLRPFTGDGGVGQLARQAAVVWKGAIYYLGPDGLVRFDTYTSQAASDLLTRLLNPSLVAGGIALSPAAYAECFLLVQGGNLYLGAPGAAGDAHNTVLYRFDGRGRQLAPTRLTNMALTSGCATSGTASPSALFLAGREGQLYTLDGTGGDKSTPGAAGQEIPWALETRRYGQDNGQNNKIPLEFASDIETPAGESVVALLEVRGDSQTTDVWSKSYTVAGGVRKRVIVSTGRGGRGRLLSAKVSGASKGTMRIHTIAIRVALGTTNP